MPRQVDQDVHSAFITLQSPDETAKCSLVQCTYCQQVRAKNTTRQKQHLLQCAPYLQQHGHDVALQAQAASASTAPAPQGHPHPPPPPAINDAPRAPHAPHMPHPPPVAPMYGHDDSAIEHTNLSFMPNPRINGMVIETPPSQPQPPQSQPQPPPSQPQPPPSQPRPSLGANGAPAAKKQKTKPSTDSSIEIPLKDVHASFEEFRAKPDDKCLSSRCKYCNQVRAKNTSRQREHLLICVGYQAVLKEKIPANNLLHQFDADDVASSLALPAPSFDLDFRMSIRTKPKLNIGAGTAGQQSWISCIGGQWAGSWGKGILLASGQDTQTAVKDTATRIDARYLLQTNDEHPALIICKMTGWLTGEREVMERLQDPVAADNVAAHRYRLRVNMELETGDERYQDVNTGLWLGVGCRRGAEVVYDAYRIN